MKPALFTPLKLRELTLGNRIACSPMTQYSAVGGTAQPWHFMHVGSFAVSGAGLVILEGTAVEAAGRMTPGCLGLYSDENEAALAKLIADVRTYAHTPLAIQLAHAGRKASLRRPWDEVPSSPLTAEEGGWGVVGPTDVPFRDGASAPEALDGAGIERVIEAFRDSAVRAERCGFDAIELHGAHGFLLHSFFSPVSNTRTDGYGGSPERRMRLLLEVTEAVRAVWPSHKPLGFRVTACDYIDGGLAIEDAVRLGHALKELSIDYIVPSVGLLTPDFQPPKVEPGYLVHFAERLKRELGVPIMTVGMIVKPEQAQEIVASSRADMTALGRAFMDDPRWGWHAAAALGTTPDIPRPYLRVMPKAWPGYKHVRGEAAAAAMTELATDVANGRHRLASGHR